MPSANTVRRLRPDVVAKGKQPAGLKASQGKSAKQFDETDDQIAPHLGCPHARAGGGMSAAGQAGCRGAGIAEAGGDEGGALRLRSGPAGDAPAASSRGGSLGGDGCWRRGGRAERAKPRRVAGHGRRDRGTAGRNRNAGLTAVGGDCPKWGGMSKICIRVKHCAPSG